MNELPRVLASLEEYLSLKRDLESNSPIDPNIDLVAARNRAGQALNEYIQTQFNLLLEKEITLSNLNMIQILDILNSPPNPFQEEDILNLEHMKRWIYYYNKWYSKRREVINLLKFTK